MSWFTNVLLTPPNQQPGRQYPLGTGDPALDNTKSAPAPDANGGGAAGTFLPPMDSPTPPAAGRPGSGANDKAILSYLSEFARTHSGANPSVTSDPNYWLGRIKQTHPGGNVDWGYWEGRMLTPEGPPEGAKGTGGGNGPSIPPSTLSGLLAPFQGKMPSIPNAASSNMWNTLLTGGQTPQGQTLSDFLAQYQPKPGAAA